MLKARDEATELLLTVYPKAAAKIQDALLVLAEAEAKVAAANQRRPEGAEHIQGAETKASDGRIPDVNGFSSISYAVWLPARFGALSWPLGWRSAGFIPKTDRF